MQRHMNVMNVTHAMMHKRNTNEHVSNELEQELRKELLQQA